MAAVVRLLPRRNDAPQQASTPAIPSRKAVDYCQCGRGPVVGTVSFTESRLSFHRLGDRWASAHENAADLRCIDCVADVVTDVASGKVEATMRKLAAERAEELRAMMARSEISAANRSRRQLPQEGDRLT